MTHKEFFDWFRSQTGKLSQAQVNALNALLERHSTLELQKILIDTMQLKESSSKLELSKNGLEIIKEFEGFVAKPYKDAVGIWTIGYGNTYYLDGSKVKPTDKPLTKEEASKLKLDIINKDFAPKVRQLVEVPITQNQFDALVSLAYNIGTGALAKSSVIRHLNAGNIKASADAFLLWNKAGGKVLKGLQRRREAERRLFLN